MQNTQFNSNPHLTYYSALWVHFIWKLDADKVRSTHSLIYSHRVCKPWAVKLQNNFEKCSESTSAEKTPHHYVPHCAVCVCTKMLESVLSVWVSVLYKHSVSHPWPWVRWHITRLCTTSDSNHNWPRSSLDLLWHFDAHCLPWIYNHDFIALQGISRSSERPGWQTN